VWCVCVCVCVTACVSARCGVVCVTACVSGEYLVKWQGLPYSECTQEDIDLIKQHFPVAVEEYNSRRKSSRLPTKNCKVGRCTLHQSVVCRHRRSAVV